MRGHTRTLLGLGIAAVTAAGIAYRQTHVKTFDELLRLTSAKIDVILEVHRANLRAAAHDTVDAETARTIMDSCPEFIVTSGKLNCRLTAPPRLEGDHNDLIIRIDGEEALLWELARYLLAEELGLPLTDVQHMPGDICDTLVLRLTATRNETAALVNKKLGA